MVKIRSNKTRWILSAILALLILFGTFHSVFSLMAFALCGLMLVFVDKEDVLYQIFFIMPMANIFKMSPGTQSFFTIIILAFVVLHLVLPRKATLLVILFAVYVLVGELLGGAFNLFRTVKLICNFLFLSSILNSKVTINHKEIFLSFIFGNVTASVFGMLKTPVFNIEGYIGTKEVAGNIAENVTRFAGLYVDPNYYSIGLIISLCLVVILYHRREIHSALSVVILGCIFFFLLQTYSKSAVIMLVLPFSSLMYSLLKRKKNFAATVCIVTVGLVVILIFSGKISAFDVVIDRIKASETVDGMTDINALTTGRFDLWIMYIKHFAQNIYVAVFGNGISAALLEGRAAHNTYLDMVYYLGISGSFLLVVLLAFISAQSRYKRCKRNFMHYSVIICIGIMYFFLSELFYFDPPFHIFLAFMVLNLPDNSLDNKVLNRGGQTYE